MRIAIMQPYFLPYAGYFKLFQTTDLFVIYDCVQFPRRGWVHRNRLQNANRELSWLTLPLAKSAREARITELRFSADAKERMQQQQSRFPLFSLSTYQNSEFQHVLTDFTSNPVNYVVNLLQLICSKLQFPFTIAYSSALQLPSNLTGQDRILAIAKHFNADTYVNPPGGKALYDDDSFKRHQLKLKFLHDYAGSYESILPRLFYEDISTLRNEIISQAMDA